MGAAEFAKQNRLRKEENKSIAIYYLSISMAISRFDFEIRLRNAIPKCSETAGKLKRAAAWPARFRRTTVAANGSQPSDRT